MNHIPQYYYNITTYKESKMKFARRGFVAACASVGFALLTAGCQSGTSTSQTGTTGGGTTTSGGGATASTAGATTSTGGATGEKVSIAFVTNNSSDYWTVARKGTEAAAKELPNVDVQFVMPADGTAATQKSQVDDLLAKGVKAIAISPVDPTNQTPYLNQVAKKAALITQDSDAATSDRLCYIGTDNRAAGKQAGELMKEALGATGGKIMLFVGKRDAQNAKDRELGIRDALAGGKVEIIDVRTDDTDRAKAKSNVSDALVKYPDMAGAMGLWSYNGPAIISAVQDAGKTGKIKIVTFDEEDATLAGVKSGAVYATVVQQPYEFGYQAVKLMASLASGDKSGLPTSKQNIVPTEGIKKDTVDAFQAKLNTLRGKK